MAALPPFAHWVYELVRSQLDLEKVEGSNAYKKFLNSMDIKTFPLSGAQRVQSFHVLKYGYPWRRAGYVTATFVVSALLRGAGVETHYAYAYWPRQSSPESVAPEPEYVCLSSTFNSRDGEYRHRFLWYPQFNEGYAAATSTLSKIEELFLEALKNDEIHIETRVFSCDEKAKRLAFQSVDANRLELKLLIAIFVSDFFRFQRNTLQTHTAPAYATLFAAFYEKFADAFGGWTLKEKAALSVFTTGKAGQPMRTQCGQKLVPLTVSESLETYDINLSPWREHWIGQRASDFVINGVAPMFPINNNWACLDGVEASLFENSAMRNKYCLSDIAGPALDDLLRARGHTAEAANDHRMGAFDGLVLQTIEYGRKFLQLSKLAICTTGEYVGLAVNSVPDTIRRSSVISPAFTRMFDNPAMQARYLFDLCFGANTLHERGSVVHTDLHLCNMTIHELSVQYSNRGGNVFAPRFDNPVIAYVAGERGEADTYIFPHDGWIATLIDFSRAIIGPKARPAIVAEFGEPFASGFYRDQVTRALRALHAHVPDFVEQHQERLKGLLYTDFPAMFKALSAVDFLAIGTNYGGLFREIAARQDEQPRVDELNVLRVAPEGILLAEKIEQIAREYLVASLGALLGVSGKSPPIASAGEALLHSVFGEYCYPAWVGGGNSAHVGFSLEDAELAAIYNSTAPLTYSGSDYSKYPPWARFDEMKPYLGDLHILQVTADRGMRPFLESRALDDYLANLQLHVSRHIHDKPAAAPSSWIDT